MRLNMRLTDAEQDCTCNYDAAHANECVTQIDIRQHSDDRLHQQ